MQERIIAGAKAWRSQEETGFSEQVEELACYRSRATSLGRKGREGAHMPSHVVDMVKDKGIPTCFYVCHGVGGKVIMRNGRRSCEEK